MKRRPRPWDRLEALVARGALHVVGVAPLFLTLAVARAAACAVFVLAGRRRRLAIDNVRLGGLAADLSTARRLVLASYRALAVMVAESLVARRRLTGRNWHRYVTLRLSPEAEALLRDPGQGLIVASAHLGNWEVAARAVSQLKPMCVVYRPFNNPHLDAVARGVREGAHLRFVSRLDASPLRFVRALGSGEIVGLMIDQHVTKGRVAVDFLDRPAWTTKSVAMLHLTTRAPLLVAFAVRTGPLRYEVQTRGPLHFTRSGDRDKDARTITQALTDEVSRAVRAHPEQYLWAHRRWR